MIRQRLTELVTNPASGRMSTSDTIVIGAFIATTTILVWCGLTGQLDEWLWIGYLGAWVTQSQASKWQALNRDRTKSDDKNSNAG